MKYVFHPESLAEYSDAVQYYTEQRTEIAQAFINAIEDAIFGLKNLLIVTPRLMKTFDDV